MIEVRALFFASYRELLGTREVSVMLPESATLSDLVAALRSRGEPFDGIPRDPAVAVNRSYVPEDVSLSDGDEVAFIPPIAGG